MRVSFEGLAAQANGQGLWLVISSRLAEQLSFSPLAFSNALRLSSLTHLRNASEELARSKYSVDGEMTLVLVEAGATFSSKQLTSHRKTCCSDPVIQALTFYASLPLLSPYPGYNDRLPKCAIVFGNAIRDL